MVTKTKSRPVRVPEHPGTVERDGKLHCMKCGAVVKRVKMNTQLYHVIRDLDNIPHILTCGTKPEQTDGMGASDTRGEGASKVP